MIVLTTNRKGRTMIPNTPTAQQFDKMQKATNWFSANYDTQIEKMQEIVNFLHTVPNNTVLIDWQHTDIFTGNKSVTTVNEKIDQIERRMTTFQKMVDAINE